MTDEMNKSKGNTKPIKIIVIAIIAIVAAVLIYFYVSSGAEPAPSEAPPMSSAPVDDGASLPADNEPPTPPPAYEAPEPDVVEPLPDLNESDTSVLGALQGLSTQALAYAVPEEILRKFVRAVNAIEEGKVVHEYRPIVSPVTPFGAQSLGEVTAEQPEQFSLSQENFQRYDNYVTLLAGLDTDEIAALYERFYPLLEEAYAEMGLKKGNFHSVLISAVDKLLAAPIVEDEMVLVRPKVFYQFADPELEKLPPTHKLLIRMGPENARSFQESLKKLRVVLTE